MAGTRPTPKFFDDNDRDHHQDHLRPQHRQLTHVDCRPRSGHPGGRARPSGCPFDPDPGLGPRARGRHDVVQPARPDPVGGHRLAIPARGGPTTASAPGTPGIEWHALQPYARTICRPLSGLPPGQLRGGPGGGFLVARREHEHHDQCRRNGDRARPRRQSTIRFAEPCRRERECRDQIRNSSGHPHDQSRELLILQRAQAPGRSCGIDGIQRGTRGRAQRRVPCCAPRCAKR